jgi:hypothetical protein
VGTKVLRVGDCAEGSAKLSGAFRAMNVDVISSYECGCHSISANLSF